MHNYINSGSHIPQVEARKRCSRDLFTSTGRATALIDRHFWYTFLQQSMTRLTNTVILLTYTSRFNRRFSGNWQEHICKRNTRCVGSPSHLSLGSDRLNVTVCRTCRCGMYSGQSEAEVTGKISLYGWRYVHQVPHISIPPSYSVKPFEARGPNDRMTVEKNRQMAESLLTAFRWWPPSPLHPHPTLVDYNNFKVPNISRTPAWISNHAHYKVLSKITYPFLYFNCWSLGLDK